jgi:hypothetical protein
MKGGERIGPVGHKSTKIDLWHVKELQKGDSKTSEEYQVRPTPHPSLKHKYYSG